jgi:hypothetical protein
MQKNRVIIVAAITGGICLFLGLCCGTGIGWFAGTRGTTPLGKTMTREAFEAAVKGKTRDEVIQAVGRPDTTRDGDAGSVMWFYNNRTIDPITKKRMP